MHTNILVDLTNLTRIKRHTLQNFGRRTTMENEFIDSLIASKVLVEIFNVVRKTGASSITIVEDARNIWRKDIYPDYKNKEHSEDSLNNEVYSAMEMVANFFKNYTAAGHIQVARLEADDIFYHLCNKISNKPNIKNVILTSDKDMMQLICDNVSVFNPLLNSRGYRKLDEHGAGFFLFEKCIRGDSSDNIPSAYPRIQRKKLIEAWYDDVVFLNLMEHEFENGEKLKDRFEFNRSLIDLSMIPDVYGHDIEKELRVMKTSKYKMNIALQELTSMGITKMFDTLTYCSAALSTPPKF